MSQIEDIHKAWLEDKMRWRGSPVGIAISFHRFQQLIEELYSQQRKPEGEHGFNSGVYLFLPGENNDVRVYPNQYDFEDVRFIF